MTGSPGDGGPRHDGRTGGATADRRVNPAKRSRRSGTALLVLGALALAALFATAGWWLAAGQRGEEPSALYIGPAGPSTEATSTAPPTAIRRMHRALHRIGRECRLPAAVRSRADIDADVRSILRFARLYPTGRFGIDDETGTPLSLLLVTRQSLRDCSAHDAARVNAALPPPQRERASLPTAPTATP